MTAVPRCIAPRAAVADIRRERSIEASDASRGLRVDLQDLRGHRFHRRRPAFVLAATTPNGNANLYTDEPEYATFLDEGADAVIILLGTNDAQFGFGGGPDFARPSDRRRRRGRRPSPARASRRSRTRRIVRMRSASLPATTRP
jgi:hypothetical protein